MNLEKDSVNEMQKSSGSKKFNNQSSNSYIMGNFTNSSITYQATDEETNRSIINKLPTLLLSKENKISIPSHLSQSKIASKASIPVFHDSSPVSQKKGDSPLHTEPIEDPTPVILYNPEDYVIFTECSHKVLKKTLEDEYEKVSKKTFFGKMNCIECNKQVNMTSYLTPKMVRIRAKNIYDLEYQFAQDLFETKFECLICSFEVMVKEGITISCIHRFCLDCFHEYILSMIQEGVVSGIKCPAEGCEYVLSFYETKGVLSGSDLQLFEELITRKYVPKEKDFMITQCLFCSAKAEVKKNTKNYKCVNCKKEYCITCNFNHSGISCTEYQKTIKLDTIVNKIVSCPNCNQVYQSDPQGCHFLQCRCGSYFCRLCQNPLQLKDHHGDHYPDGPFANCIYFQP